MEPFGNLVSLSLHGESSKRSNAEKEKAATQAAFAIFSSFRKSDTDNPEVYLAAATRVLMAYPADIVTATADPLGGIAGEQTFLPSIAELRASLERRMAPIRAAEEKRRRYAETEKLLRESANPTPDQRERAFNRWENTKAEIAGKIRRSQEDARQEAEKRLVELYHARSEPFTLSRAARQLIASAETA